MSDFLDDLLPGVDDNKPSVSQDSAPVPRRRGRPPKAPATVSEQESVPMPPKGTIATEMSSLYTFAAIPLMAIRPETAGAIVENADQIGKAWEKLAEANPKVRAALLGLAQTSMWGALAMAHLPIVMALMSEGGKKEKDAPTDPNALGARPEAGRHAASGAPDPLAEVYRLPGLDAR